MPEFGEVALSTFDNPYNPFDDFNKWFLYDVEKGHNTCSILGRFAHVSPDMTEDEANNEINRAIDEIIRYDFENKYTKILRKPTQKAV